MQRVLTLNCFATFALVINVFWMQRELYFFPKNSVYLLCMLCTACLLKSFVITNCSGPDLWQRMKIQIWTFECRLRTLVYSMKSAPFKFIKHCHSFSRSNECYHMKLFSFFFFFFYEVTSMIENRKIIWRFSKAEGQIHWIVCHIHSLYNYYEENIS